MHLQLVPPRPPRALVVGLALVLSACLSGCLATRIIEPLSPSPGKPSSASTRAVHATAEANLPIGDFADGSRFTDHSDEVLIAPLPPGVGAPASRNAHLGSGRPDRLHPSLFALHRDFRNTNGLVRIADGVYQIRGDLGFTTLVRGKRG